MEGDRKTAVILGFGRSTPRVGTRMPASHVTNEGLFVGLGFPDPKNVENVNLVVTSSQHPGVSG